MLDGRMEKAEEAAWKMIEPCSSKVLSKKEA
jgi:hypothetical protein